VDPWISPLPERRIAIPILDWHFDISLPELGVGKHCRIRWQGRSHATFLHVPNVP